MKKKITTSEITLIGLMAAMVYVASRFLQIPIPTAIGETRLHMGNVMCLLGGLLLGPVYGGLSAGIGSAFFDLTSPAYITSAPFTFAFKFFMAWSCGILYKKWHDHKNTVLCSAVAGTVGALSYVILYLIKSFISSYFLLQMPFEAVILAVGQKGFFSVINGIIAVIAAVPLSIAIRPAISKMLDQVSSAASN